MSDLLNPNQEVNQKRNEKTVSSGISQVVVKDIFKAYNPSAPVNRLIVADNDFYKAVHNIVTKKSFSFMPYLLPNVVFHADTKSMKDISKNVIKLVPYNLLEGAVQAGKQIYSNSGVTTSGRTNYRLLSQTYFLYSSLCVGINNMGQANLVTSSLSVLNYSPIIQQKDKERIIQRLNPNTDDISNGIIQCVEFVPKLFGYDLKPAIINADKPDYVILPKAWVDYLIDNINRMLMFTSCKITYLKPNNTPVTITACNKPIKGDLKQNLLCDFIKNEPKKYGVIQCINVKNRVIEIFPVTHFVSLMPCKEV